jgi:hypothetical protein
MRGYHAHWEWHGHYGAYEAKHYVVVAETFADALNLVLQALPGTIAAQWEITEISHETGVHYVSDSSR